MYKGNALSSKRNKTRAKFGKMNFVQLSDSWFNLQQVESIEVSRTQTNDTRELYTVVISLASGRTWSRRDLEKHDLDGFKLQIAAAFEPSRA
jgi:hypothetical protein